MNLRCAHFADVHFRGLTRHEEYRDVFSLAFEKLEELKPDVIFIGGDIVHSKTQGISPELIQILTWWFTSMAKIAPVHVILGNHDGLMLNEDRLDAISPIINAIGDPNIKLFKKSGTYDIKPGFKWGVFSCFDTKTWKDVKPVPGYINIATFHGAVNGSLTDQEWEINGDSTKVDFFDGFDFSMLGDIHKRQFLTERIAYPGSTIQQNYGENIEKGFLFWDIKDQENFEVDFIPLENKRAFRTYDWKGNVIDTISQIPDHAKDSRFRIVHQGINQVDFKHLQNELRDAFNATEVVSKNESSAFSGDDITISTSAGKISRSDLRSFKYQDRLMTDFVANHELTEENRAALRDLHKDIFSRCAQQVSQKCHQWRLRQISFDNTFAYGENNVIDFDKLHGITGIFGKNRSGKSSIPGTIVYGLFNSTDRGTLKNVHVINNRKTYCRATVDISIGGEKYRVDRQTVKRTNRKGAVSAPTSLNLFKIDDNGEIITDSTEEQRRETEKVLREIVGTLDDFMMTSFASQGDMNAFIREGATKRKAILTRFLDLQMFDEMLKVAKNQMLELRGEMKSAPDRDWGTLIQEKTTLIDGLTSEREEIEQELKELKDKRDQLKIQLSALPTESRFTQSEINEQTIRLQGLEEKRATLQTGIIGVSEKMQGISKRVEKIGIIREQFPIDELREESGTQRALIRQVDALEAELNLQVQKLENKVKTAKKLDKVPCGDQFPKCPYIKDAHKSSRELDGQKSKVSSVRKELRALKSNLEKILSKGLDEKIERYSQILEQEQEMKLNNSELKLQLREFEANHQGIISEISHGKEHLRDMRLRSIDEEKDSEIVLMRNNLTVLEKRISEIDAERLYLTEQLSISREQLNGLSGEKEKFGAVRQRWEIYSVFTQAVDKKGIPLTILSLQLPQINAELRKILQGVVNFDLELTADAESNNMDILVDYGDSKRIIECGSGMEKMISSLALRVALINVCNAPRSDILIIDEGFGALDDKNIEACSRLLISLKKYFSNILIISHVDAVKDVVDNVLDIQKEGKDARITYA